MANVDTIAPGAPVWADLSTSDFTRAAAFYHAVFGWDVPEGTADFGGYATATLRGANVAGLSPKWGDPGAAEAPDAWTVYLHTPDAAAAASTITANGGQLMMDPMEVGSFGTMAVGTDPAGAVFGIWQPNTHKGFGVFADAGAPCWFETLSQDVEKAKAFYPATFGLGLQTTTMEDGSDYNVLLAKDEMVAGITDATSFAAPGTPSHWLLYLGVPDTDAAIAQIESLGGAVVTPAQDSEFGRWAIVADPMGAVFAIVSVG
ncbi:MAG: VOC family protein [Thermomicrobiales bacterium]